MRTRERLLYGVGVVSIFAFFAVFASLCIFALSRLLGAELHGAFWPACAGTVALLVIALGVSVPLALVTSVYAELYVRRTWIKRVFDWAASLLAAVPSVVWGVFGLIVWIRTLGADESLWVGGVTLALVAYPIVLVATRDALRSAPPSIREAGFALGASEHQVVWRAVIPSVLPQVITGVFIATARVVGEAAPLIVVGASSYVTFAPQSPAASYTALPIQVFSSLSRPIVEIDSRGAASLAALLFLVLALNLIVSIRRARA